MSGETNYIWMNGEMKPFSEGTTHVMSHGLHYGSGFFEGIKCYSTDDGNPAVFRLADHMARLHMSAAAYRMKIPYSVDELVQASLDLIKANGLTDCYIRPIAYYGYASLGVHPKNCPVDVAIATFNWGAYLGAEALEKGVRVTLSPWRKIPMTALPVTSKACGQYLNSLLAVQDAKERGYDEAILLNGGQYISEGSGQNLFIVKDGAVYTNSDQASILMGITRDTILKFFEDLNITVHITDLSMEMLEGADEAFFTGTASEVTPIREIDGHTIGSGRPGEITKQVQKLYFDVIQGRNKQYNNWLTYVN